MFLSAIVRVLKCPKLLQKTFWECQVRESTGIRWCERSEVILSINKSLSEMKITWGEYGVDVKLKMSNVISCNMAKKQTDSVEIVTKDSPNKEDGQFVVKFMHETDCVKILEIVQNCIKFKSKKPISCDDFIRFFDHHMSFPRLVANDYKPEIPKDFGIKISRKGEFYKLPAKEWNPEDICLWFLHIFVRTPKSYVTAYELLTAEKTRKLIEYLQFLVDSGEYSIPFIEILNKCINEKDSKAHLRVLGIVGKDIYGYLRSCFLKYYKIIEDNKGYFPIDLFLIERKLIRRMKETVQRSEQAKRNLHKFLDQLKVELESLHFTAMHYWRTEYVFFEILSLMFTGLGTSRLIARIFEIAEKEGMKLGRIWKKLHPDESVTNAHFVYLKEIGEINLVEFMGKYFESFQVEQDIAMMRNLSAFTNEQFLQLFEGFKRSSFPKISENVSKLKLSLKIFKNVEKKINETGESEKLKSIMEEARQNSESLKVKLIEMMISILEKKIEIINISRTFVFSKNRKYIHHLLLRRLYDVFKNRSELKLRLGLQLSNHYVQKNYNALQRIMFNRMKFGTVHCFPMLENVSLDWNSREMVTMNNSVGYRNRNFMSAGCFELTKPNILCLDNFPKLLLFLKNASEICVRMNTIGIFDSGMNPSPPKYNSQSFSMHFFEQLGFSCSPESFHPVVEDYLKKLKNHLHTISGPTVLDRHKFIVVKKGMEHANRGIFELWDKRDKEMDDSSDGERRIVFKDQRSLHYGLTNALAVDNGFEMKCRGEFELMKSFDIAFGGDFDKQGRGNKDKKDEDGGNAKYFEYPVRGKYLHDPIQQIVHKDDNKHEKDEEVEEMEETVMAYSLPSPVHKKREKIESFKGSEGDDSLDFLEYILSHDHEFSHLLDLSDPKIIEFVKNVLEKQGVDQYDIRTIWLKHMAVARPTIGFMEFLEFRKIQLQISTKKKLEELVEKLYVEKFKQDKDVSVPMQDTNPHPQMVQKCIDNFDVSEVLIPQASGTVIVFDRGSKGGYEFSPKKGTKKFTPHFIGVYDVPEINMNYLYLCKRSGELFDEDLEVEYSGEFKNGKKHGKGMEFRIVENSNGIRLRKVVFDGTFDSGHRKSGLIQDKSNSYDFTSRKYIGSEIQYDMNGRLVARSFFDAMGEKELKDPIVIMELAKFASSMFRLNYDKMNMMFLEKVLTVDEIRNCLKDLIQGVHCCNDEVKEDVEKEDVFVKVARNDICDKLFQSWFEVDETTGNCHLIDRMGKNTADKTGYGAVFQPKKGQKKKLIATYVGYLENGDRDGEGVLVSNDTKKKEYSGMWKMNIKHGKGMEYRIVKKQNFVEYEGGFKDGVRHGRGELYDVKEGKYINGVWNDGVLDKDTIHKFDLPLFKYSKFKNALTGKTLIGQGGYGKIYRVKSSIIPLKIDDSFVAVKVVENSDSDAIHRWESDLKRSMSCLSRIKNNEHLLETFGYFREGANTIGCVMQCCEFSVDKYLRDRRGRVTLPEKIQILLQTAKGIGELHKLNIMHRDLKWSNILLTADKVIKLTDFDTLREEETNFRVAAVEMTTRGIGTPGFLAPEVYSGSKKYNIACDIFSFGIMMYSLMLELPNPYVSRDECTCGVSLEAITESQNLNYHISKCGFRPKIDFRKCHNVPEYLKEIMPQCVDGDASARPRIDDIVKLFQDVNMNRSWYCVMKLEMPITEEIRVKREVFQSCKIEIIKGWIQKEVLKVKHCIIKSLRHRKAGELMKNQDIRDMITKNGETSPILEVDVIYRYTQLIVEPKLDKLKEILEARFVGSKISKFEHSVRGEIRDDEDILSIRESPNITVVMKYLGVKLFFNGAKLTTENILLNEATLNCLSHKVGNCLWRNNEHFISFKVEHSTLGFIESDDDLKQIIMTEMNIIMDSEDEKQKLNQIELTVRVEKHQVDEAINLLSNSSKLETKVRHLEAEVRKLRRKVSKLEEETEGEGEDEEIMSGDKLVDETRKKHKREMRMKEWKIKDLKKDNQDLEDENDELIDEIEELKKIKEKYEKIRSLFQDFEKVKDLEVYTEEMNKLFSFGDD